MHIMILLPSVSHAVPLNRFLAPLHKALEDILYKLISFVKPHGWPPI